MKKLFVFALLACCIAIFYHFSCPQILKDIKKADKIGIIKEIKEIKIQNVKNPINAAIEEYKDEFIVAFRVNKKEGSYIGLTFLDQNFQETTNFKIVDVKTNTAEDPRIFQYKENYFLAYNDKLDIPHFCRSMHIAKLNEKTWNIDYKTNLDQHIKPIEKNWVPFTMQNKLFLSYGLMPHKVMQVATPKQNNLIHLVFENNPCFSRFFWKWGEPRGGTPAKLVDSEFLAFFHSCFGTNKKKKFYVMGAYTFQAKPPYKITKVSTFPITFGHPQMNRVIFPTGFVLKKQDDKEYIYLSFGHNDKTSKIAIIDKQKLFEHMKSVY